MPGIEKCLLTKSLNYFIMLRSISKFFSKIIYILSQGVQVKISSFKGNFEKMCNKIFQTDMICSRTFSFLRGARWSYWHCIVEQKLANADYHHSIADERNWKSVSNVLHAFHITWLMGQISHILLVKLEKCLSLHFMMKSLNLAFVTTLKTVRKSDVTTYKNTQRTKQTI